MWQHVSAGSQTEQLSVDERDVFAKDQETNGLW
jgi:hypothetical protein